MIDRIRTLRVGGALLALAFGAGAAGLFPLEERSTAAAGTLEGFAAGPDPVVVKATDRLVFRPDSVVIRAGEAVRWENAGVIQHTATADPAEATLEKSVALPEGAEPFDSGRLARGETFTHVFGVPGRYRYFCIPHEGAEMVGTVIVKE